MKLPKQVLPVTRPQIGAATRASTSLKPQQFDLPGGLLNRPSLFRCLLGCAAAHNFCMGQIDRQCDFGCGELEQLPGEFGRFGNPAWYCQLAEAQCMGRAVRAERECNSRFAQCLSSCP